MHAAPVPPVRSPEEAHANAAFDALLWALSRPGLERELPEAGEGPIVAALLDRECRVFAAEAHLLPAIEATGAETVPLARADHAFLGALEDADVLERAARGSDLYPDGGATLVVAAALGVGGRLRLTGPGVDGAVEIRVGGLPAGFWETRARVMRYPMGFEVFLLDGARVIGVPRSTAVEML